MGAATRTDLTSLMAAFAETIRESYFEPEELTYSFDTPASDTLLTSVERVALSLFPVEGLRADTQELFARGDRVEAARYVRFSVPTKIGLDAVILVQPEKEARPENGSETAQILALVEVYVRTVILLQAQARLLEENAPA